MAEEWSLPEKHLVAELAVGLSRRLLSILGRQETAGPEKGYVWHMASSDFENGCNVLWRLGVALAAYGPDFHRKELSFAATDLREGWPSHFRFLEETEFRAKILTERQEKAPLLREVLAVYIAVACNYGGGDKASLPSARASFVPNPQYAREIEALETLGYAQQYSESAIWGQRIAEAVIWTDKIGPAMRASHLWSVDGQSFVEQAESSLASECLAALADTPEVTKRLLSKEAKRLSELEFALVLRDRFDGLFWAKNADGSARPHRGDVSLVKAVYEALRRRN